MDKMNGPNNNINNLQKLLAAAQQINKKPIKKVDVNKPDQSTNETTTNDQGNAVNIFRALNTRTPSSAYTQAQRRKAAQLINFARSLEESAEGETQETQFNAKNGREFLARLSKAAQNPGENREADTELAALRNAIVQSSSANKDIGINIKTEEALEALEKTIQQAKDDYGLTEQELNLARDKVKEMLKADTDYSNPAQELESRMDLDELRSRFADENGDNERKNAA